MLSFIKCEKKTFDTLLHLVGFIYVNGLIKYLNEQFSHKSKIKNTSDKNLKKSYI